MPVVHRLSIVNVNCNNSCGVLVFRDADIQEKDAPEASHHRRGMHTSHRRGNADANRNTERVAPEAPAHRLEACETVVEVADTTQNRSATSSET